MGRVQLSAIEHSLKAALIAAAAATAIQLLLPLASVMATLGADQIIVSLPSLPAATAWFLIINFTLYILPFLAMPAVLRLVPRRRLATLLAAPMPVLLATALYLKLATAHRPFVNSESDSGGLLVLNGTLTAHGYAKVLAGTIPVALGALVGTVAFLAFRHSAQRKVRRN